MESIEIAEILHWLSEFGGVYPEDKLPFNVAEKFYIFNTDPSHKPGRHWVAVYMGKVPEFFDSLGHPPSFYSTAFEYFMVNNGPNYVYNCQRLQNYGAKTCGHYCIYYILKRRMGYSMNEIVQIFDRVNLEVNEEIVTSF